MASLDFASWSQLGNHSVRQVRLYEHMRWDAPNLNASIVAAAPFGGPIAVTRDTTKLTALRSLADDEITIYSASGKLVRDGARQSGLLRSRIRTGRPLTRPLAASLPLVASSRS